jgi:hypothetical protein
VREEATWALRNCTSAPAGEKRKTNIIPPPCNPREERKKIGIGIFFLELRPKEIN